MSLYQLNKGIACKICGSVSYDQGMGIISPWIREIIQIKKIITRLSSCKVCQGATFSFRYSTEQMQKLYQGYRGKKYLDTRFKWEKYYSPEYNNNLVQNKYTNMRKKKLVDFLNKHFTGHMLSIVDVGGGSGEFIPNFEKESPVKYVLDINNIAPNPGIIKLGSLSEKSKFSLIIYSHVLEHVNNPTAALSELLNFSNNVYVETPYGVPNMNPFRSSRVVVYSMAVLSNFPSIYRKIVTVSFGRKNRFKPLVQSEHLNFFLPETFFFLAQVLNCKIRLDETDIFDPMGNRVRVIRALFTKNDENLISI
jgi:hypothetical protein